MTLRELKAQIALGEDSRRQFKRDVTSPDALAAEMAAFANSEGGVILIGVTDSGTLAGLMTDDVARLNQIIGNVAAHNIRSPLTVQTENVKLPGGRLVIMLTVPKGLDRPYFDKNGSIWLKSGADKRRVNSKEELRRLFQMSDQFHADELPTKAGIEKLDKLRFRDFLRDRFQQDYPDDTAERLRLLQNMNLATDEGVLNLAGVLLFAERPEWIKPQFVVKAIRYPGNDIHATQYVDTEDFEGPLRKLFENSMAFVLRNLPKVQAGQGVNSPGTPEIPPTVFEELLVNALVHRDYLVSAPIRIFIFDNRIEIISPGHLPNNLTVDKIRSGNSNIRNPILVSYVAKGLLPYHGLGSGIKRALEAWPRIVFEDDHDGCLFTATVLRKETVTVAEGALSYLTSVKTSKASVKTRKASVKTDKWSEKITKESEKAAKESEKTRKASVKTSGQILDAMRKNAAITIAELAAGIGVAERSVERNIQRLQRRGRLRRVGPDKGGRWEVREEAG